MSPLGPPYQWRADGGYLPPPPPPPSEDTPSPPPPYTPTNMLWVPGQPIYLGNLPQPITGLTGPIGVAGLFTLPPGAVQLPVSGEAAKASESTPPPSPLPAPKAPSKAPSKENKKRDAEGLAKPEKKTEKAVKAGPRTLRPGIKFLYPLETTRLHVFRKAAKIWLPKYIGQDLNFKIWAADTQMTVRSMIERVMGATTTEAEEKCKGWIATEVLESGDGKWEKGTSVEYASEKAKETLASMSWNVKRGDTLPPVWITIHKA